jgi:hypothetical protein
MFALSKKGHFWCKTIKAYGCASELLATLRYEANLFMHQIWCLDVFPETYTLGEGQVVKY